ncbi:hypothetical protein P4E94_02435 [Pontiellaceae bacterium B12219]|nr:hypothetical protein [Pontiellaceae bacterium B12219]
MNTILLICILLVSTCVFIYALRNYDGMLQFPFLMTCDLVFFLGPQLAYMVRNNQTYDKYSNTALSNFLLIILLFYVSAVWGYYSRSNKGLRFPDFTFNSTKMIVGLYGLVGISMYGRHMLAGLSEELKSSTQWTGLPVRYLFFSSVGTLCIPLGLILFLKYRRKIILPALWSEISSTIAVVVLGGRRSPAAFLGIMVLTGMWFARRMKISRLVLVAGGLVFFMFVTNIGVYRHFVKSDDPQKWSKIAEEVFDFDKTISKFAKKDVSESTSDYVDALNGALAVSAVGKTFRFDYGIIVWNQLIFRWVPGQIIGQGLKKSLMLNVPQVGDTLTECYSYRPPVGTCIPGYAEIFASFGFLGCIFMFYAGRVAHRIWDQAMDGNLIAQIAHFALAPMYLRFGGGGIWLLLTGLGFWVIFLFPILFWAKENRVSDEIWLDEAERERF